jgi:hypothetical protein
MIKGTYSPLNLNTLAGLLTNSGLRVNESMQQLMGQSTSLSNYTQGSITTASVLSALTDAINIAYTKIGTNSATQIPQLTYDRLVSIGAGTIPALGNSKPSTYTRPYSGEITRHGFLRLIPLQAYREFYINNGSYSDFFTTLSSCRAFKTRSNKVIRSLRKSEFYLDGIYSNMTDLITADISGVTLSTFFWGTDLIASGRAIDLSSIDTFGAPDNLLRTLKRNNAISKAMSIALLASGLSPTDITDICDNKYPTTLEQQKKLYGAFNVIVGNDLADVLIPLNCQTVGLESLADLLSVKKLFPNSYTTLTFPMYNAIKLPTNSKTYYLLFNGSEVSTIPDLGFGDRLRNILPETEAFACDAFSMSMMQVKNIKQVNIEKFSQVVANLESAVDLNVNGTSVPTDTSVTAPAFSTVAKGSGDNGQYNMCDFFGAMTDLVYPWAQLEEALHVYEMPESYSLVVTYNNILNLVQGPGPYTQLDTLIDNANTAILNLKNSHPLLANAINAMYDSFGTNLTIEQTARELALGDTSQLASGPDEVYSFMDILDQYALDTEQYETAQILESIADITTVGGRSLIGSMREARNAHRLGLAGLELDNNVDYDTLKLPKTTGTKPNAGTSFPDNTSAGQLADMTIITGAATTPGSLGGSPEISLIPSNLNLFDMVVAPSIVAPAAAIDHVTTCNCDCWDLLDHN